MNTKLSCRSIYLALYICTHSVTVSGYTSVVSILIMLVKFNEDNRIISSKVVSRDVDAVKSGFNIRVYRTRYNRLANDIKNTSIAV